MEQKKANQAIKMLNTGQQLNEIICAELILNQLKSWE